MNWIAIGCYFGSPEYYFKWFEYMRTSTQCHINYCLHCVRSIAGKMGQFYVTFNKNVVASSLAFTSEPNHNNQISLVIKLNSDNSYLKLMKL